MDVKEYYELWCRKYFDRFMRIFMKRTVYHAEAVPEKDGFILAAKHQSFMDIPVLGATTTRYLRFMAKEELFKIPILGAWMRKVGSFAVSRGRAGRTVLTQASKYLKEGDGVAIFPEGTRRNPINKIGSLNEGVAFISKMANAPILPVGIAYKWGLCPLLRVVVVYGDLIDPGKYDGDRHMIMSTLKTRMELSLKSALEEVGR